MLMAMSPILQDARERQYGVAAPGVNDMQTVSAVFEAARELRAPMILDCVEMNDLEAVADITKFFAGRYPEVPAALNLDHGHSFDVCARAIRAGFTSVMIDCSKLPFDENVRITAEVVRMAHAAGVSVEAELGRVGSARNYSEDRTAPLTDPAEAVEFVKRTSVDCLTVAIGTAHGLYEGETPELDFQRLAELRAAVPVPLVLHGGSSTGDDKLARAVRAGISKINLFSDLSSAGTNAIRALLASGRTTALGFLPLSMVYGAGIEAYKQMVMHYIEVFGSRGVL
ncbi:MAG TPA: class II fructose-bisphosphate aldolase [Bacillota bacterium]|nr:class II fructose-bisphosphate aldolase [Bacillota bacterium]